RRFRPPRVWLPWASGAGGSVRGGVEGARGGAAARRVSYDTPGGKRCLHACRGDTLPRALLRGPVMGAGAARASLTRTCPPTPRLPPRRRPRLSPAADGGQASNHDRRPSPGASAAAEGSGYVFEGPSEGLEACDVVREGATGRESLDVIGNSKT